MLYRRGTVILYKSENTKRLEWRFSALLGRDASRGTLRANSAELAFQRAIVRWKQKRRFTYISSCTEGDFCELRVDGVLRSSSGKYLKSGHLAEQSCMHEAAQQKEESTVPKRLSDTGAFEALGESGPRLTRKFSFAQAAPNGQVVCFSPGCDPDRRQIGHQSTRRSGAGNAGCAGTDGPYLCRTAWQYVLSDVRQQRFLGSLQRQTTSKQQQR